MITLPDSRSNPLRKRLEELEKEKSNLETEIDLFEATLRSHLINEIIEEQELSALYKKLKKEKKLKRLEQKQKGKNYQPGLKKIHQSISKAKNTTDNKEKKRLYREALLHTHPDKFSTQEDKQDLATEVATKLIEIYNTGTLEELIDYHAYIFNDRNENKTSISSDKYLDRQIEKLEKEIEQLKKKQTYKVLHEYENPLNFLDELKLYYADRLIKLRKRTRKA